MAFRIEITDHSTGKVYRPMVKTVINWLDRNNREAHFDSTPWENYSPIVNERNWIDYATIQDVIDMAASHFYGKNCGFFRDKGLADQGIYGQIVEPCSTGGLNCVTGRIRFTVTVNGEKVNNSYELNEALIAGI